MIKDLSTMTDCKFGFRKMFLIKIRVKINFNLVLSQHFFDLKVTFYVKFNKIVLLCFFFKKSFKNTV